MSLSTSEILFWSAAIIFMIFIASEGHSQKTGLDQDNLRLQCRIIPQRKAGKIGDIVLGQIELKNVGEASIEIRWYSDPMQYLNLIVRDPDGKNISVFCYGDQFSPYWPAPQILNLHPRESYSSTVNLLGTVKKKNMVPGSYRIQAIYNYENIKAVSEVVEILLK